MCSHSSTEPHRSCHTQCSGQSSWRSLLLNHVFAPPQSVRWRHADDFGNPPPPQAPPVISPVLRSNSSESWLLHLRCPLSLHQGPSSRSLQLILLYSSPPPVSRLRGGYPIYHSPSVPLKCSKPARLSLSAKRDSNQRLCTFSFISNCKISNCSFYFGLS